MRQFWIVDDDEKMGRAIGRMLKLLDGEATLFLSARAAVQTLLTGRRPDLMIVEINLPEISGLDLTEFLRRRPEWRRMPIVILSSEAANGMVEKALRQGGDAYLVKPATLEELEKAIQTAFSKHKIGE
ncbi:MAG: response regulator [Bacteroidota bacterium]